MSKKLTTCAFCVAVVDLDSNRPEEHKDYCVVRQLARAQQGTLPALLMKIPEGKVLIDKKELDALKRELDDYAHYADAYGNMSGTCETGYPQHPGYICARCGSDRSSKEKCGRLKK